MTPRRIDSTDQNCRVAAEQRDLRKWADNVEVEIDQTDEKVRKIQMLFPPSKYVTRTEEQLWQQSYDAVTDWDKFRATLPAGVVLHWEDKRI